MKKVFTISVLLFCSLFLKAQITVTSADMPSAGQSFTVSLSYDLQSYNFQETGNNFTWNFQDMESLMQIEPNYITVNQTPNIFWLFFLGSANLVLEIDELSLLPGVEIENGYQFFNKTTSKYSDVGLGLIINGIPLPLKFSNADVIYEFPMNPGYNKTSNANLSQTIPSVGHITVERERVTVVDGWGTLNTPYGSFQTLRLKSNVTEYDSIYVDTLGQGYAINREYIEYKWLGNGRGLPLLTVTEDPVLGSRIEYLDSLRVANPYGFTANPVSSSQIDLGWNKNFNGNDVLLAWSPNEIFGTPVGNLNPGDPIPGGGTVCYTGADTTFSHTGLDAGTTYYYKLWSRSNNIYSTGITASATTLTSAVLPGDANCDGIVSILDVISIVNFIMMQNPSPFCPDNADVNGDGIINIIDAVLTVNIILGTE
ncbi:MAG: dockerin type I repeat-containing protein [Bacteroidales bacterium]